MSHDHHSSGEMHPQEMVSHEVQPYAKSITIFCVLAGLAVLALFVGFSNDLGIWKVAASLGVSCIQASVLAFFFMDLKQADKLTWLCAAASVFWTGLMFLFTLTDYLTRHLGVL